MSVEGAVAIARRTLPRAPSPCLAGALPVGLLGNALVGTWWLDPVVGLLIAGVAVREGLESWRGDGCCVGSPLGRLAVGEEPTPGCCTDDCCR